MTPRQLAVQSGMIALALFAAPIATAGSDSAEAPGAKVRVIHLYQSSEEVQAHYGYRERASPAKARGPDQVGTSRFERMVETKAGRDQGYVRTEGALNHTIAVLTDESGQQTAACLDGDAHDVHAEWPAAFDAAGSVNSASAATSPKRD